MKKKKTAIKTEREIMQENELLEGITNIVIFQMSKKKSAPKRSKQ